MQKLLKMYSKINALLYILLPFIFAFCNNPQVVKRSTNADLKYSSYRWQLNSSYQWEFYLASYMHIDSTGKFTLIRDDNNLNKPQYFNGTLNDSIRKTIDSILIANIFFPDIGTNGSIDTASSLVYDGLEYLLDYKIAGKSRTHIQYINTNSKTPANILYLTSLLDSTIKKQSNKIDSFSLGSYLDTLKKISSYNLPPPPQKATFKPPKINAARFSSPTYP